MSDAVPLTTLLEHRAWVRALARSLVADPGLADDVEQETWLAAMRSPPRDAATARSWLAVVARNFARQGRRGAARRASREEAAARPEALPATDDVVAQADLHKRVVLAVMDLGEPYRTTVLLRFFEGLSIADAAARMGVPEETFRTRLRRGIERLRERLAPRDGRGRAALLALASPGSESDRGAAAARAHPSASGVRAAWLRAAAASAVVAATAAAWWLARPAPEGPSVPAGAPTGPGDLAAAFPGGGPPAAPPAAPAPPDDEDDAVAPAGAPKDATVATPREDALRLSIRTAPEVPRSGEPFRLVAVFSNTGAKDVSIYVPESANAVFPEWRLRREDGALFAPVALSAQTMWMRGHILGSVEVVLPGRSREFAAEFDGFEPADPESGARQGAFSGGPLPPGRYVVTCGYEQKEAKVPWTGEAFRVEYRDHPGLWTGALRAERAVLVEAPAKPQLLLDAPARVAAGADARLRLRLVNPGSDAIRLRGRFEVVVHAKGGPSARAAFRPAAESVPATSSEDVEVEVAAGSEARFAVDLELLTFAAPSSGGAARPINACGFHELRPRGGAIVGVEFTPAAEGEEPLRTSWVFANPGVARDRAPEGLRLAAAARRGEEGAPVLDVRLVNAGDAPIRVVRRLTWPAELSVSIRVPGREDEHPVWKGDAAEPSPPLRLSDFVLLEPGQALERTLDLVRLLAEPLAPGAYEVRVVWQGLEDGRRFGLGEPRAARGRVEADGIRVSVH